MTSNIDMRLVYENSKQALQKAFPDVKQDIASVCKLTQSTLRLEQPLVIGATTYNFPVLVNQDVFSNTEKRLLQQDSAVVYQVGLFVGAPASATDGAFLPDAYPNFVKYGANAVPLQAIWNGYLSVAVNNDILVPNWDTFKHYNSPETQQTAAVAANSPRDEMNGLEYGFSPMEPNIVLIGSKNNVITLTLPVGLSAVTANSRVILILRTIIAQNSTVVS